MSTSTSVSVTNISSYTFQHSLNRLDLNIRVLDTSGNERNDLISRVIPDPSDPKNTLIFSFASEFTGRLQVLTNSFSPIMGLLANSTSILGGDNFSATTDPSSSNNLSSGYTPGSRWYNTVTKDYFLCLSSTISAATWEWQNTFSKYITIEKTATQAFNTTLSDVLWNTSTQNVSNYYSYASNIVTINRSGDYRINNNLVSISSGGAATSHKTIIVRKRSAVDFVLPLSECYRTVEQNDVKTGGTNTFIASLLQGDQLRMRVQVFTGTQAATIQPAGTFMQIERVG